MIMLRMIAGGVGGLFAGALGTVLLLGVTLSALGFPDAWEIATSIGPIGGLAGGCIGATWQILRAGK